MSNEFDKEDYITLVIFAKTRPLDLKRTTTYSAALLIKHELKDAYALAGVDFSEEGHAVLDYSQVRQDSMGSIETLGEPIHAQDVSSICIDSITWDGTGGMEAVDGIAQSVEDALKECDVELEDALKAVEAHKQTQTLLWQFY